MIPLGKRGPAPANYGGDVEKKKCACDGEMCAALFVGLAFGVVAGAAIYASAYPIFQSKNWAEWAQVIAVTAAVFVAIWAPIHHFRQIDSRAQRDRAYRDFESLEICAILGNHATRAMTSSTGKIKIDERPIRTDRLNDVHGTLRSMITKGVPSVAGPIILEMQCELAYQISAIELNNAGENNLSTKYSRALTRTFKVRSFENKLRVLRDQHIPS